MFKVRFYKDSKTVSTYNNKVTVVNLKGYMDIPYFWPFIPAEIHEWKDNHPNVIVDTEYCKGRVILNVTGKSTCSSEDGFDSKRGERVAESRAKIALYKFMVTLLNKIIMHYRKLIFGDMDIRLPELYKDGIYKYYCKYSQYLETEWKHLNNLIHNQKD